jgi:hypothetical protein
MWVESSFDVKGRRVGVSVKRIDAGEAEQMAAHLAWFARAVDHGAVDALAWPETLQRILSDYVEMTMDPAMVAELDTLSTDICAGALGAFIRVNHLDASIQACLCRESECVN